MTQIYIKPVFAWSCRYGNSYTLVRTKRTARNKIAWWVVFRRYGNVQHPKELPRRYKCECAEIYNEVGDDFLESHCPVHNTGDGYLRRLHDRFIVWLEKGYALPDSNLAE